MIDECTKFGISDLLFILEEDIDEESLRLGSHILRVENTEDKTAPTIYLNLKECKVIRAILDKAIENAEGTKNGILD